MDDMTVWPTMNFRKYEEMCTSFEKVTHISLQTNLTSVTFSNHFLSPYYPDTSDS